MKTAARQWEKTLEILHEDEGIEEQRFSDFIAGLTLASYDKKSGLLFLCVENEFKKAFLEDKYEDFIRIAAKEAFETDLSVRFLLPEELASLPKEEARTTEDDGDVGVFNPRYTFDNFIIGDNCRFAAGAAQAVAQSPGKAYSPLFIYGGSGLGKTHLMNAIGIYIMEHFPKKKLIYVSSETFTEEFVTASMQKKMNAFKTKYRNTDVLLIDDIQFISEKEKTVEEVFNTYNTLYTTGKQMVFTSDRPPKDILGIDERLQNRLGSGLLVDLQPPSYEIKVAILQNKAKLDGLEMDEGLYDVITFISDVVRTNVRELDGAFNRVTAFAKLMNEPFSKALAKRILKDVVDLSPKKAPAVKDIKKVVASHFGIPVSKIDSEERTRTFSRPRQIAIYICREMTGLSFPKIADVFSKDYSTVHYAYKTIANEVEKNDELEGIVREIMEEIENRY